MNLSDIDPRTALTVFKPVLVAGMVWAGDVTVESGPDLPFQHGSDTLHTAVSLFACLEPRFRCDRLSASETQ